MVKQLQQSKNDYTVAQQRLKEADKRLQEADQKYGGLISREDSVRELNTQIIVSTDRLKQLNQQSDIEEQETSAKISALKAKLQGLEEQEIVEAFVFY